MWSAQREERLSMGDDLTRARPVEHFVYFKRKKHALNAANALVERGFDVSTDRDRLKAVVCATRPEDLTDENIQRFLGEVIGTVESHGGDYDGWGAETA